MAIYDRYGNQLFDAYALNGGQQDVAYDLNGAVVFQRKPTLKIMSYNVQKWGGSNAYKAIQDIAFADGADVVGIQEWGTSTSATIGGTDCVEYLNGFDYSAVWVSTQNYNHTAIASKFVLADRVETVYSVSHERRSYTKAYITVDGIRIAFFNTHLDYQEDSTTFTQASELLNAVKNEEYFVLTGDLNVGSKTKEGTGYQNIVQPFIDEGFNVANSPVGQDLIWTFYNGKTVADSTQITPPDNIITSANISIESVYTIDTKLSAGYTIDHIPLVAEVTIL